MSLHIHLGHAFRSFGNKLHHAFDELENDTGQGCFPTTPEKSSRGWKLARKPHLTTRRRCSKGLSKPCWAIPPGLSMPSKLLLRVLRRWFGTPRSRSRDRFQSSRADRGPGLTRLIKDSREES